MIIIRVNPESQSILPYKLRKINILTLEFTSFYSLCVASHAVQINVIKLKFNSETRRYRRGKCFRKRARVLCNTSEMMLFSVNQPIKVAL